MDTLKRIFSWGKSHLLVTILVFATFLRLLNLSSNPPSLNWDEVSMGYTSYSLLETGKDEWGSSWPLLFRSYGEWKSPVYIYLLLPFIKIFGLNAWGVRLPAALAGILAVYLTFTLGKKLYSEKVGLWAAFLLSVSPWHLMLSRPAFEAGVSLTLILAGIYNFLLAFSNKSTSHQPSTTNYLLPTTYSAIFFGLAPHTYNSAKVVVPLLILSLVIIYRRQLNLRRLLLFGGILFAFALPLLLSLRSGEAQGRYKQVGITTDAELTTNFYEYRKTFPLPAPINRLIFSKYSYFVVKGFQNWISYFSPSFLVTQGGVRPQHNIPYRGVLYLTEFVFALYGLTVLRKSRTPLRHLPLLLIAFGFIPAALTKDAFHVLRSILTLPGWQLLAALSLAELSKQKPHRLLTLGFSLFTCEIIVFLTIYFAWYPKAFARDWQYGYAQATQYAVTHLDQYDNIFFTKWYGEPQLFVAFYGQLDPREYQKDNAALIRYETMGLPWLDQLDVYKIGKFSFSNLDWKGPGDNRRNLYIGKGDDFWADTEYLKQIKFPDGGVAFNLVEGQ